jgi:hypothetical protein
MNSKKDNDYPTPSDLRPKKNDILHRTDGKKEDMITANLNKKSFFSIATSFFSAANNLATNKDKAIAKSWVYPIVYMYGHYMELILKEIIRIGSWYEKNKNNKKTIKLNEYPLEKEYKVHNLKKLWDNAENYMYKIDYDGFNSVKDELNSIKSSVNQLNELYGGAMKFRYADEFHSEDIDIQNLKNKMSIIEGTIGGYILGIYNKISN